MSGKSKNNILDKHENKAVWAVKSLAEPSLLAVKLNPLVHRDGRSVLVGVNRTSPYL